MACRICHPTMSGRMRSRRIAAKNLFPSFDNRLAARCGNVHAVAVTHKNLGNSLSIIISVLDHQYRRPVERAREKRLLGFFRRARPARKERKKSAASTQHAVHADFTPLRLDDLFRQRQAETRALMFLAEAQVQLLELSEQCADIFGSDADALVFDFDAE